MLKDVIEFVKARTGLVDRATILREINYAWNELWATDDLENSLFEISMQPIDSSVRLTLPWYVHQIRGVKQNFVGRERIAINTPRPYYHNETYMQSPYSWRVLGRSPTYASIANGTTISLELADAQDEDVVVTLSGKTDNATRGRDVIVIPAGTLTAESSIGFLDLVSATKDIVTTCDIQLLDSNSVEIGIIPNKRFEASNLVIQVTDKCYKVCNFQRCFDILYKIPAPYLYYDEDSTPFDEVLMNKTMEWFKMRESTAESNDKAILFAGKSATLLKQFNSNENSMEHIIDVGKNRFETLYPGHI